MLPVPKWEGSRAQKALAQVRAHGSAKHLPCVLCGQPIDYSLRKPNPGSCSVQHVKPRALYPHLTWEPSNWAPAHLSCNVGERRGDSAGLGVTSDW